MKVKLDKIVGPEFNQALNQLLSVPINAAIAFQIAGSIEQLRGHQKNWAVVRGKLLEKYGEKDETGNLKEHIVRGKSEFIMANQEAFNKEYTELVAQEVDIVQIPFKLVENMVIPSQVLVFLLGTLISNVAKVK